MSEKRPKVIPMPHWPTMYPLVVEWDHVDGTQIARVEVPGPGVPFVKPEVHPPYHITVTTGDGMSHTSLITEQHEHE